MLICMRTTLNLDDHLMHKARLAAIDRRTSLTAVIEDALRTALDPVARANQPFQLLVFADAPPLTLDVADRNALEESLADRGEPG